MIQTVSLYTFTYQAKGRGRGRKNSSTTVSSGLNCQELQESRTPVISKSANWCFTTVFRHSQELLNLEQISAYDSQHLQQRS